ncbi:zinc finger CCHC domain-containing protein 8 homolog isoform X4 [Penaeus chinensis]|uniref:zinc finger CCHC domain-containing protein 8 homolog isoform X4 n=1 Tax=Penaeus chinensis TaxID=139456 RepID=UPI001FB76E22|nr:zinc finger CCHC domain-containing protein 8 homolog isoform X4 [Penaeus chinensis]
MEGCDGSETSSSAEQKSESMARERTGNGEACVKEESAVDVESSERNVPDRDHTVSSLSEIITLDSTADSSVIMLDNSSCVDSSSMKTDVENKDSDAIASASSLITLDSTANSSMEEVQLITQADSSSIETDVQDKNSDAVASASGVITLDSTANSSMEEVQFITQAGSSGINESMHDAPTRGEASSNSIITLDTTANSSVEDIQEITQADSSSMKEDGQNTSKGVSASSSSMFTLDSTVDSSVEDIQGITQDSSSRKGDLQDTNNDTAMSPNGMFTIDATADDIVEDIQEEEVNIPEGISLDIEGEEEECSVGPVSRLDIVPSYDASFTGILTDVEYNMETGKKINDALPKMSCFNCMGDHSVSECPKPQDMQRIAANRKKHNVTRVPNVRYHEDGENKYGHFQPGKFSENLRYALGLRPNQLPVFIYRMRVLGYPPGWLRDAEVHQADMKLYDASGKSVTHPDLEDGETDPVLVKYKPEKLVGFPGFNEPMPHRTREEGHLYNCPPMQPYHQRPEFLKYMNMNRAQAYKKKKLKSSSLKGSNTNEADVALAAEMEVDDSELNRSAHIEFNPPLPSEPLPPPPPDDLPEPPPPPPPEEKDMEEGEISEDSQASLGDLEEKRLKILRELEDAASQGGTDEQKMKKEVRPAPAKDRSSKTDVRNEVAETSEESRTSNKMSSDPSESENSVSSDTLESASKKMKQYHRSHSKGFKLGAAIPDSCTPFKTLPGAELWKVDVSDHINFDNLPDALGTWEKMKGLMTTVRKRVRELQADEDE